MNGCEIGRAGLSGSMLSGVTYISKWGSSEMIWKRQMARTLIPSPGRKVSRIQGRKSSPVEVNLWPETSIRRLASSPVDRRSLSGRRISSGFLSRVFSGPER